MSEPFEGSSEGVGNESWEPLGYKRKRKRSEGKMIQTKKNLGLQHAERGCNCDGSEANESAASLRWTPSAAEREP